VDIRNFRKDLDGLISNSVASKIPISPSKRLNLGDDVKQQASPLNRKTTYVENKLSASEQSLNDILTTYQKSISDLSVEKSTRFSDIDSSYLEFPATPVQEETFFSVLSDSGSTNANNVELGIKGCNKRHIIIQTPVYKDALISKIPILLSGSKTTSPLYTNSAVSGIENIENSLLNIELSLDDIVVDDKSEKPDCAIRLATEDYKLEGAEQYSTIIQHTHLKSPEETVPILPYLIAGSVKDGIVNRENDNTIFDRQFPAEPRNVTNNTDLKTKPAPMVQSIILENVEQFSITRDETNENEETRVFSLNDQPVGPADLLDILFVSENTGSNGIRIVNIEIPPTNDRDEIIVADHHSNSKYMPISESNDKFNIVKPTTEADLDKHKLLSLVNPKLITLKYPATADSIKQFISSISHSRESSMNDAEWLLSLQPLQNYASMSIDAIMELMESSSFSLITNNLLAIIRQLILTQKSELATKLTIIISGIIGSQSKVYMFKPF
jgi:hypothetical protein